MRDLIIDRLESRAQEDNLWCDWVEVQFGNDDHITRVVRDSDHPDGDFSEVRWTADHAFVPVNGHPDDDECTFRSDGTDATYCGRTEAEHDELTDCEDICMDECQGPCGAFS
jgi:hypothetical protein